jgi:hypothetical protein
MNTNNYLMVAIIFGLLILVPSLGYSANLSLKDEIKAEKKVVVDKKPTDEKSLDLNLEIIEPYVPKQAAKDYHEREISPFTNQPYTVQRENFKDEYVKEQIESDDEKLQMKHTKFGLNQNDEDAIESSRSDTNIDPNDIENIEPNGDFEVIEEDGNESPAYCRDSEDGKDETVQGVVDVLTESGKMKFVDFCYADSNLLHEFVCSGDELASAVIECAGGCEQGICLGLNPIKE